MKKYITLGLVALVGLSVTTAEARNYPQHNNGTTVIIVQDNNGYSNHRNSWLNSIFGTQKSYSNNHYKKNHHKKAIKYSSYRRNGYRYGR